MPRFTVAQTFHAIMAAMQMLTIHGSPTEEEAAAIAAIVGVLEQEIQAEVAMPPPARPPWRVAALLEAQRLAAPHDGDRATWGAATRAERSRRWSRGIV